MMAVVGKNAVAKEIKELLGSYLQIGASAVRGGYELKSDLEMTNEEIALLYKPCTRISHRLGTAAETQPLTVKRKESAKFKKVSDAITLTHKRANGKAT